MVCIKSGTTVNTQENSAHSTYLTWLEIVVSHTIDHVADLLPIVMSKSQGTPEAYTNGATPTGLCQLARQPRCVRL